MKVIASEPRIAKIAGISATDKDRCKLSPFCHTVKVDGGVVLTNTFTRFFCFFEGDDLIESSSPNWEKAQIWIKSLSEDDFITLAENRVLIDESENELETYLNTYFLLNGLSSYCEGIDRYNILTSTGCNARCYYCFEEGYYQKPEHMTIEMADHIADYIIRTHSKDKKIYLRWFGGEPLINIKVIDHISERLNCAGIDYFSTMSTNGLLCNKTVIDKAVSLWRMSKIRITIDGWGKEHDKRKQFVGSHNNFEKILDNIDLIVNAGIIMVVRLSVDAQNYESLVRVVDYFSDKYKGIPNFKMYSHCLHDDVSNATYLNNKALFDTVTKYNRLLTHRIMDTGLYDYERLQPDGFRMYLCAAQDPTKISITPAGSVCRCECLSNEDVSWGKINGPVEKQDVYDHWHKNYNVLRSKCRDCSLLPLCTPYAICPLSHLECHTRFESMLDINMAERFRRFISGEAPIELIDSLPIQFDFI